MNKERMKIGKVSGAHGLKGELIVFPLTDDPGRFYELETIFIGGVERSIEGCRLHKGRALLTVSGIKNRTQAEALKGAFVEIDREQAQELEDDEFYIADLIHLTVYTGGLRVGELLDVLQTTGGADTLEISVEDASLRPKETEKSRALRPLYVPFRKEFIEKIDLEEGVLSLTVPEEYWDL